MIMVLIAITKSGKERFSLKIIVIIFAFAYANVKWLGDYILSRLVSVYATPVIVRDTLNAFTLKNLCVKGLPFRVSKYYRTVCRPLHMLHTQPFEELKSHPYKDRKSNWYDTLLKLGFNSSILKDSKKNCPNYFLCLSFVTLCFSNSISFSISWLNWNSNHWKMSPTMKRVWLKQGSMH